MDPFSAMKMLDTFGPYALTVFMGIAYWHKDTQINKEREARDQSNKEVMEQLLATIESNTIANTKLEAAIDKISETMNGLHNLIITSMNR